MELFIFLVCLVGISICCGLAAAPETDIKTQATALVRAYKAGDKTAFNGIVALYEHKIYNLCLNYVKQSEEAKDLTQDIFITIFRALHTLKDDNKFSPWLYQIAVNHCRNRYKRLQRRGFFNSQSLNDPDSYLQLRSDDHPQRTVEQKNIMKVVLDTIGTMSETEQEILHLRDLQDLSYEEISQVLGVPLGTVKSKLNRARTRLKNRLKPLL